MAKNWPLFLLAASLIGLACNDAAPESKNHAPARPAEALTRDMDTQIAHATKVDARIHVDMLSRTRAVLFSVDIQPAGPVAQTISWSIPPDAAIGSAGGALSGSLTVGLTQLPELETAIDMAAFAESRVIGGMKGQNYDNWGCDLPFTGVASCSPKGACCDVHDACYALNNCSASSWWNPFASPACKGCNAAVVACIGSPTYFPGPSVCCAMGNCGRPR